MWPRGCLKLPTLPSSNPPPTRLPLLPSPRPDAGPWVLPPQAVVDALALPPRRKRGPSIQPTQDGAAFARARLTGPLGAALPCIFEEDAGTTEQELVGQLDSLTLQTSIDAGQPGRLQSALNWFDAFLAATRVVPFVPIEPGRELECYAYNQRTLERFSRFIRLRSSAQRGQPIKGDTISGYVSAIKIFRSKQAGMHVTSSQVNVHSYDVGRSDRRADGPPGDRSRCLGVGGSDFDAIATSTDRASDAGCQDFAVGHAAYSALLRGGEVGTTDGGCWDPRRDLTLDSVELHPPCEASDGRPWLSLWVCAIKDVSETRKPVPIPIRRRCTGVRGSDPRCSYDAIVEHWERRCRAVPHAQRSVEPLFVRPDGSHWTTEHVRSLARRWAAVLGIPPEHVGGKSFRIRGATDLQAQLGAEQGARVVRERGRWFSDVSYIYARASAKTQLDASATMADAAGGALEALIPGWTQPAHR